MWFTNGISFFLKRGVEIIQEAYAYFARVLADGGSVEDRNYTNSILTFLKNNELESDAKLLISPSMGIKTRTSTIWDFVTKLYSADATPNDATQTTELNQLYLNLIGIPAIYNPNGDSRLMIHPDITVNDSTAWTFISVMNWNGSENAIAAIFGNGSDTASVISLRDDSNNRIKFINESGDAGTGTEDISGIIGKNAIVSLIATGTGSLKVYLEEDLLETITVDTDFVLSQLMVAMATANRQFAGKLFKQYFVQSDMSSLIASSVAYLRGLIPELESVVIGSEEWALHNFDVACTSEGNLITKMTSASDTEKIAVAADRDFSSDTGYWTFLNGTLISGGVVNLIANGNINIGGSQWSMYKNYLVPKVWGKVTVVAKQVSGGGNFQVGNRYSPFITKTLTGSYDTYTGYVIGISSQARSLTIGGSEVGAEFAIDSISVKEVGWSGLSDLYTWLIDPVGGNYTVANALKEVASYCHYNNDTANAAINQKLYTYETGQLLVANLASAGFGWHIPTEAEWDSLITALGGLSVAGKHLKALFGGFDNSNADNSSGFSAVAGGTRDGSTGAFSLLDEAAYFMCADDGTIAYRLDYDSDAVTKETVGANQGMSIRLIKD